MYNLINTHTHTQVKKNSQNSGSPPHGPANLCLECRMVEIMILKHWQHDDEWKKKTFGKITMLQCTSLHSSDKKITGVFTVSKPQFRSVYNLGFYRTVTVHH